MRAGRDQPEVAWAPAAALVPAPLDQARVAENLEVATNPVRVQFEPPGQLLSAGRDLMAYQPGEDPRPGPLREHIVASNRQVHRDANFYTCAL